MILLYKNKYKHSLKYIIISYTWHEYHSLNQFITKRWPLDLIKAL